MYGRQFRESKINGNSQGSLIHSSRRQGEPPTTKYIDFSHYTPKLWNLHSEDKEFTIKSHPRIASRKIMINLSILISIIIWGVVGKQNILFIVVDDLRPSLGCYGDSKAYTPNIDNLAKRSVLFTRAYAQQSLCAPSRNSLLTSRRPDTLKLYDFYSYWREKVGNFSTLPEHLKDNGYTTMSIGKVFHPGRSSNGSDDFPYSWTEEPFHPFTDRYKEASVCRATKNSMPARNIVCPVFVSDMPNKTLPDIETLSRAKSFIRKHSGDEKPFFLAIGFQKPHIPIKYPQRYLKHHPLEKFDVPDNYKWPDNVSYVAYNPWTDLRKRQDIKNLDLKFPYEKIPSDYAKLIIQSYYAAVTYIDDLIGLLMKQLSVCNLENRTTVIFTSDHGWSLGEHGEWAKYSNFEVALRVPVMFSIPGVTYDPTLESNCSAEYFRFRSSTNFSESEVILNRKKNLQTRKDYVTTDSMIELVDIFPTIADMVNLSIPMCPDVNSDRYNMSQASQGPNPCSEGVSFLPVIYSAISGKRISWKTGVFSQYPRPGIVPTLNPNSDEPRLSQITIMGYTINASGYRYTAWLPFDHNTETADWSTTIAEELYDHELDVQENINLATKDEYLKIKNDLKAQLKSGWREALPQRYKRANK